MSAPHSALASAARAAPQPGTGHRWKVLTLGVAANASFSAAFSGIPTTAVLMRAAYHFSNAELGAVLGLMGLGIALSELPWGMLTDRWGDRPVLLAGLLSTAAALLAMALWAAPAASRVPATLWVGAGLLVVGLLGGSVNGASGRAVMVWFSARERGLAMSVRQTAVPLGGALGALLLPWLALRAGYAAVYAALAAGCAVSALLAWRWLVEPPALAGAGANASTAAAGPAPLRNPRIWRMVGAIGILCAPQFAILSFGSIFLHDYAHAGVSASMATMATLQVGAMAMRVASGRLTDRLGNRRGYLCACAIASAVLLAALALFLGLQRGNAAHAWLLPLLMGWLALTGIAVSAWHGVAYAELVTLSGSTYAGTALGMANTSVFVVCFLTPLSIPRLLALGGWPAVWAAGMLCGLAALSGFIGSVRAQASA
jgi:MFS family permease